MKLIFGGKCDLCVNAPRSSCRGNQEQKLVSVQTSLFLCLLRSCRRSQCRSAFVRGHNVMKTHLECVCYQDQEGARVCRSAGERLCRGDPPLLDQAADDAQRVVDGALGLLDHQLVGASHHDAHRLPGAGAACDLHGATTKCLEERHSVQTFSRAIIYERSMPAP